MSEQNEKPPTVEDNVVRAQPGEKLRLARETYGLSVDDVSVRLKLSPEKINAMERGDVADIATPVFVAGYIRTYARLLDLSEADVLADFDELLPVQASEDDSVLAVNDETYGKMASDISSQFSLREKSSGNALGMVVLAGVLLVALVYFLWPAGEVVRKNAVTATTANEAGSAGGKQADSNETAAFPETAVSAEDVTADVTTEESVSDAQAVVDQVSADEQAAVNKSANSVTPEPEPTNQFEPVADEMKSELILNFNSDSWAEVQDARGQRLVYRLGKSGSRRMVTGVAPFMVQLGFVQGVDIIYNGAPYDLSRYANRRSVRLRIGEAGDRMGDE